MYFCAGACEISVALANAQVISFNSLIDCCVFMVRLWLPSPGCLCGTVLCPHPFPLPKSPLGRSRAHRGEGMAIAARHGVFYVPVASPVRATSSRSQDGWLLPLWVFNLRGGADQAGGEAVPCSPLLHLLTSVNLPVSKQISKKNHQIGCASLTLHL